MSESADSQTMVSEERSRCWSSNVEDGSEEQTSEGGWPSGSGITVTTEISIQPHADDDSSAETSGASETKSA
ncbi:hypothetical protein CSOJ01_12639 [Colletotrichum sojae]|uniref:Uncharacterized protein n=1 Tax=Colletotrichum sojae TaxID=2175907 RepID=A0A8H6IV96_9PEZI|nr:hypothetical protein CSOJ01_12639 [Colletotrichum sojae]